jgi:hypothetical protein
MQKRILAIIIFTILVVVAIIYLEQNQVYLSIPFGVVFPSVSLSDILLFLLLMVDALTAFVEYRERKRRRKYIHSLDLIKQTLGVIAETGHVDYNNDVIIPSYAKWAESSSMFSCIVQHLKDKRYKKTWQAYENGRKYDEGIINEIKKKIEQYREVVEQKLTQAKISIPTSDQITNYQTKNYNQKFVKHIIFKDTKRILKEGRKYNELKIYVSSSPNLPYLNWGTSTVAVAEEGSLKSLQQTIDNLENDETIVAIIREINSLEIGLEANKELEQFNHGREEIVRQVRHGRKPLSGKCDLCP